jgi:uncharacterized protein (TIGR03083 family)
MGLRRSGDRVYERMEPPAVGQLYRAQRDRIGDLVELAGPLVDDVPVPSCPSWTIADLTAHLAGTTSALLARDYPGADSDAWTNGHVVARRGRSARENLAEWNDVGPRYDELLVKNEGAWGALLYDAIAHEHDVCDALGEQGRRSDAAVCYALDRALWQLDVKALGAGIGTLAIRSGSDVWSIGDGEPVVGLQEDDRWELFRALGSRRTEGQLRAMAFDGDPTVWIGLTPFELPVVALSIG